MVNFGHVGGQMGHGLMDRSLIEPLMDRLLMSFDVLSHFVTHLSHRQITQANG
jgi:hypothetical protein